MRAKLCSLLMFGLVPSVLHAQDTPGLMEFKAKMVAKYGATAVGTFTSGAVQRIEFVSFPSSDTSSVRLSRPKEGE